MSGASWDRRDFLGAAAMLALVLGAPAAVYTLQDLPEDERPTPRIRALLREVCQQVIPRTGTAGAGDVGVDAFLVLALAHGLGGSRKPVDGDITGLPLRNDGSLRHDIWLAHALDRGVSGDFLALPPERRHEVLAALDAEAFPPGPPPAVPSPWVVIKGLILTGYYTSEEGGSRELRYQLIPGRFDNDIPLHKGDRAFSSDWTAVEFG